MDQAPPDSEHVQVEWPEKPAGPPPERESSFAILKELPFLILIAFLLALLIKTFLIQAFYIPSASMEPTLIENDRVLVNRLVYRFREPRRGEIIVFVAERDETPQSTFQRFRNFLTEGLGVAQPAERDFIKRIIGLPGETLEYRDGTITITKVNGVVMELPEPYTRVDTSPFGPREIPEDHYFVMGDNRANSSDSRSSLGEIAREDIIGKSFVRIWPPRRIHVFQRPDYNRPRPAEASAAALPLLPAVALLPLPHAGAAILTARKRLFKASLK